MAGNHNIENWKPIKGFEDCYEVSDLGAVKSIERMVKHKKGGLMKIHSKMLKPRVSGAGYPRVNLNQFGVKKDAYIHQLMAVAFLNHNIDGHNLVVDHIDNDKLNNNIENLQLITHRVNSSKDKKNTSSKYTGVCWHKPLKKWAARIRIDGVLKHLGYFVRELDASFAYKNRLNEITI